MCRIEVLEIETRIKVPLKWDVDLLLDWAHVTRWHTAGDFTKYKIEWMNKDHVPQAGGGVDNLL